MVPVRITEEVKTHLFETASFYIILHNLCLHDGDMEMDKKPQKWATSFPKWISVCPSMIAWVE